MRSDFSEGRQWLGATLAKAPARSLFRAEALKAAGALARGRVDFASACSFLTESLEIYQELKKKQEVVAGPLNLGILGYSQGDDAAANPLFQECLGIFHELGHLQGIRIIQARILGSIQAALRPDRFAALLAEGRTVSLEAAFDLAVNIQQLPSKAIRLGTYSTSNIS